MVPDATAAVPAVLTHAIRELVRSECLRASNGFGPAFFDQHVLPVAAYGRQLAIALGADPQVVELAAYLHDLSAVRDLACIPTHHLESARIARTILLDRGCTRSMVEAVCRCIASHSAPVGRGHGTLEEVCLSNADVMAQLARPAYWFFYLHRVRGLGLDEALSWWNVRVERAWSGLVKEARSVIAAEHAAALRFLQVARQAA
jgi:hypothetical protein